jgi:hypothetical protein
MYDIKKAIEKHSDKKGTAPAFLTGDGKNNISVNEWRKSCSNVCKFLHL